MANTYTLINSTSLSTTAASVTFSAIPATYNDLVLKISVRTGAASLLANIQSTTNSSTSTNNSYTFVRGDGASALSSQTSSNSYIQLGILNGNSTTANSFGSAEIYIPSYNASQNKPMSIFTAQETNATTAYVYGEAGLISSTSAITSITLTPSSSTISSGSSFWLYGIKNS